MDNRGENYSTGTSIKASSHSNKRADESKFWKEGKGYTFTNFIREDTQHTDLEISQNVDFYKAVAYVYENCRELHRVFKYARRSIPALYVHPFVISSAKVVHLFAMGISVPDGNDDALITYPITYFGSFDMSKTKDVATFVVILGDLLKVTDFEELVSQHHNMKGVADPQASPKGRV